MAAAGVDPARAAIFGSPRRLASRAGHPAASPKAAEAAAAVHGGGSSVAAARAAIFGSPRQLRGPVPKQPQSSLDVAAYNGSLLPQYRKSLGGVGPPASNLTPSTVPKINEDVAGQGEDAICHNEIFGSPRGVSNEVAKESSTNPWAPPERQQLRGSAPDLGLIDIFGKSRRLNAPGQCGEEFDNEAVRVAPQWPKPGADSDAKRLRAATSAPPSHLRGAVFLEPSEGEPTARSDIFGTPNRILAYADGTVPASHRTSSEPPVVEDEGRGDAFGSSRRLRGAGAAPPRDQLLDGCEVKRPDQSFTPSVSEQYTPGASLVMSDGRPLEEPAVHQTPALASSNSLLPEGRAPQQESFDHQGDGDLAMEPHLGVAYTPTPQRRQGGGRIFRPTVNFAFGPPSRKPEPSWRKLAEMVWQEQKLSSQAKEVLQEFQRRADKAEGEHVARFRRRREYLDKSFTRLRPKPSPRYLDLRSKEHFLAKHERYVEAAKIRDEAEQLRKKDDENFILDVQPQALRSIDSLKHKERQEWLTLQEDLHQELCGMLYHGLAPFPEAYGK